nr:hypothetical protein PsAHV6-066 [Psittacid alphaherpesvirus 6]
MMYGDGRRKIWGGLCGEETRNTMCLENGGDGEGEDDDGAALSFPPSLSSSSSSSLLSFSSSSSSTDEVSSQNPSQCSGGYVNLGFDGTMTEDSQSDGEMPTVDRQGTPAKARGKNCRRHTESYYGTTCLVWFGREREDTAAGRTQDNICDKTLRHVYKIPRNSGDGSIDNFQRDRHKRVNDMSKRSCEPPKGPLQVRSSDEDADDEDDVLDVWQNGSKSDGASSPLGTRCVSTTSRTKTGGGSIPANQVNTSNGLGLLMEDCDMETSLRDVKHALHGVEKAIVESGRHASSRCHRAKSVLWKNVLDGALCKTSSVLLWGSCMSVGCGMLLGAKLNDYPLSGMLASFLLGVLVGRCK